MIPLKDHAQTTITPVVTWTLITANVLVFLYMMTLSGPELEGFIQTFAVQPAEILKGVDLIALFTSMFLHGGFGHILGNMLFLNIFGDNLEEAFGHLLYAVFYVLAGLAAAFLQIIIDPGSTIPMLGASGAIAGLLGAYIVLFPHHQVDVLIPFGGFFNRATVPAFTMLFYWIAAQFLQGLGSLGIEGQGGVAYFAHIGGFLAGVVVAIVVKPFLKRHSYAR